MSTNVVKLRDGLTAAQIRRGYEWAEAKMTKRVRSTDQSLCRDMARFIGKIDVAAFLAGVPRPALSEGKSVAEVVDPLERVFLQLYQDAHAVWYRMMDEYPNTQRLGRRKARRVSG